MKDIKKIIFILMFIILCTGCAGQRDQTDGLLLSGTENGAQADDDAVSETADIDCAAQKKGQENAEESLIYVQVSGAVKNPGVYTLPDGSRIFQAIELAGGVREDADLKSLNQAHLLTDGEMIWVMTLEEAERAAEETVSASGEANPPIDDGKLNLNTATKEELMELPGIGAAKAESILAWRDANGSFTQIEDLMKIEGIKEGVFSKLEAHVKVQ